MPTRAAKSPAGKPLRRQVSSSNRRCSPVNGAGAASPVLTRRLPRNGVFGRGSPAGFSSSPGSPSSGEEGEQMTSSSSLPAAGGPSVGPARGRFPVGGRRSDPDGPEPGNKSAMAPPLKRVDRFVIGRNYRTDFLQFSRHYFGKD